MEDLTVGKKESNSSIQLVQILRVGIKQIKSPNQIINNKIYILNYYFDTLVQYTKIIIFASLLPLKQCIIYFQQSGNLNPQMYSIINHRA